MRSRCRSPSTCRRCRSRSREEDTAAVDLSFAFPFYGQRHRTALVSADGRVLFGSSDAGSGDKGLGRFLAGPPSVAAFFTDLDPARGGSITARVQDDRATLVWSAVPGGGQINGNTFEIVLHAGGEIDLVYGTMESREAVAGVTPGGTLELTRVDLSAAAPVGAAGALVERFSETEKVDLVSVLRRFYASHPDAYEQVVVYTTRPLNPAPGTLAFEVNIQNAVTGIGLEIVDSSAAWGSAGTLESVVYMDAIDPYVQSDGFEFLGHEVGSPLARPTAFPRRKWPTQLRPPRPRRGALELLPRHPGLGARRQLHPRSRRRTVRDRGLRARLQRRSTST